MSAWEGRGHRRICSVCRSELGVDATHCPSCGDPSPSLGSNRSPVEQPLAFPGSSATGGRRSLLEAAVDPEATAQSPWTLRFASGPLEEAFLEGHLKITRANAKLGVGLAILLVALFGILDVIVQPDIADRLWFIRFGVIVPGLALVLVATFRDRWARHIEVILLGIIVVGGGGILWMILISPAPGRYYYYAGLILVITYNYTFLRLRFSLANAAGWAIVLAYLVAELIADRIPWTVLVNNMFFFVAANVIGMFAAYLLESLERRNFLQELLVRRAREFGRYWLTAKIGAGGMGEVWRAEHRMLARPAAIKLIRPEMMGTGDLEGRRAAQKRFSREARATALLRSPHTVEIYDFGVNEEGTFYYVMELLEGYDLQRLVHEFGPVAPGRVVHLLRQVCHSLGEAHESGLIHRDVKPANIHVCRYGREVDFVKVLDFGIVHATAGMMRDLDETQGVPVGTPTFMAPEQITGDAVVDGRSDLYGVGCVAYWLLTGHRLFEGRTPVEMLANHLNKPAPAPSLEACDVVPASLDRIVLACLEKDPDRRPASADELLERLAGCDDVPEWTQADARIWWADRVPAPPDQDVVGDRTLIPA